MIEFNRRRVATVVWFSGVYFFALIGFVLSMGYLAVSTGITDVAGTSDAQTERYATLNRQLAQNVGEVKGVSTETGEVAPVLDPAVEKLRGEALCQLDVLGQIAPRDAYGIWQVYQQDKSVSLLVRMNFALSLRAEADPRYSALQNVCTDGVQRSEADLIQRFSAGEPTGPHLYTWMNGPEWQTIVAALTKDAPTLNRAAADAGVEPRLLASTLIVEQLRLYYTQRELFERVFRPLTILSTANKMAWGVMAIKEKSAISVEQHLRDASSPFYLGPEKEQLLDYTGGPDRYARLANEQDHYYSYLYGGLMLKQFEAQWKAAGFPIGERPEIYATLYNIGFDNSEPKENPQVGGSTIEINGVSYTFGSLAYEFYYSSELRDIFPFPR